MILLINTIIGAIMKKQIINLSISINYVLNVLLCLSCWRDSEDVVEQIDGGNYVTYNHYLVSDQECYYCH